MSQHPARASISEVVRIIRRRIDSIAEYRQMSGWTLSCCDGLSADTLGGAEFAPVAFPCELDRPGEYWLANSFRVPEQLAGISIAGTALRLRCFMTLPTQVYVNGALIFDERYWTDFQMPEVTLSEEAKPGATIEILAHVSRNDSFEATGDRLSVTLFADAVEDAVFRWRGFLAQLDFMNAVEDLRDHLGLVEQPLLELIGTDMDANGIDDAIRRANQSLHPVRKAAKRFTVHLVGHAHIDMDWLWPREETESTCLRDFETMDRLMSRHPDLHFTQSQAAVYDIVRHRDPELFDRVKARIASGRWELAAGTWTEGDLNMVDGESIARHILLSRRFTREHFGSVSRFLWEPDTFGHPASIPQIMRKSGIEFYYHFRESRGHRFYLWRGIDGSEVPAYTSIYLNALEPDQIADAASVLWRDHGVRNSVFVYGVGDHGGGPTEREIKRAALLDALPALPSVRLATMSGFFDAALEEARELPVVTGDLNPVFDGCYTAHRDIKEINRRCENLLQLWERALVLAGKAIPSELDEAWRTVLFNQFHDILCGCSVSGTYAKATGEMREKAESARSALILLLPGPPQGVRVWNLEGFRRTEVVGVPWTGQEAPSMLDSQGKVGEAQLWNGHLYFRAEVDPLAFSDYVPVNETPLLQHGSRGVEEFPDRYRVCNGVLELDVSRESGVFLRMVDIRSGQDYVLPKTWRDERYNYTNNMFRVDYEAPHPMSAWVIGPVVSTRYLLRGADVRVLTDGPLLQVIEVIHRHDKSTITEKVLLYRDAPWIDLHLTIVWNERSSPDTDAPMLRLSFMPELSGNPRATHEIPFGSIERRHDGTEFPASRWVDVSDASKGMTLVNDGCHGFSVQGSAISATCLRTSYGPDPIPDRGTHTFGFRLIPHGGPLTPVSAVRQGLSLNRPLIPLSNTTDARDVGVTVAKSLQTSRQASFVRLDGEGVVLTALKPSAYLDGGVVVRVLETNGVACEFVLRFKDRLSSASEILIGEDGEISPVHFDGHTLAGSLRAFEFKSYLVTFQSRPPDSEQSG